MQPRSRASPWSRSRATASSSPIATRGSGRRWTRCATRTTWKRSGLRAKRPGRSGSERRERQPRLLARPPGAGHRPHRFQGELAGAAPCGGRRARERLRARSANRALAVRPCRRRGRARGRSPRRPPRRRGARRRRPRRPSRDRVPPRRPGAGARGPEAAPRDFGRERDGDRAAAACAERQRRPGDRGRHQRQGLRERRRWPRLRGRRRAGRIGPLFGLEVGGGDGRQALPRELRPAGGHGAGRQRGRRRRLRAGPPAAGHVARPAGRRAAGAAPAAVDPALEPRARHRGGLPRLRRGARRGPRGPAAGAELRPRARRGGADRAGNGRDLCKRARAAARLAPGPGPLRREAGAGARLERRARRARLARALAGRRRRPRRRQLVRRARRRRRHGGHQPRSRPSRAAAGRRVVTRPCRSCGAALGAPVLDLGETPISNAFRRIDDAAPDARYPLRLFVCPACFLAQVQDVVPREALFHADYAYLSSESASWRQHVEAYAARMIAERGLGPASTIVEVGSNDGALSAAFARAGVRAIGVDPAANAAGIAAAKGVETVVGFFGAELAGELAADGVAADVMAANNVLAHVPDLNDFVAGFARLLAPGGVATFEFPLVSALIAEGQYDTIYHEHYSYLSLTALRPLFARHGLQMTDVERLTTHGGSVRLFVRHAGAAEVSPAVRALEAEERAAELDSLAGYATLQEKAERHRARLRSEE